MGISIHALREEGDQSPLFGLTSWLLFLSTPSARRATPRILPRSQTVKYFYPRPPRGGRLNQSTTALTPLVFLSTPSARRATGVYICEACGTDISIHALREEGDWLSSLSARRWRISIHALREEGDSKNRDKISIFL